MEQLQRSELLLGEQAINKLEGSRVAVFGIGGVGTYAVEALARAGVGAIDVVDNDVFSLSNLNRQLFALRSTLGMCKTDVARQRILDINPACRVCTHKLFYLPDTADSIELNKFDYVLDAVDTITAKLCLIENCHRAQVPIISCMGTGNKLDPTAFQVGDIYSTHSDALARVIRKELKKRGIPSLKVVWSPEKSIRADSEMLERIMKSELSADSSRRDVPGSVSFVPGAAGLIMAGEAIKDLIAVE